MSKIDLVAYLDETGNWEFSGDEYHLKATLIDEESIFIEFNNTGLTIYFMEDGPISLRIPYSEIRMEDGVPVIPALKDFIEINW